MQGSHTLEKFVNGVARDIEDPETKLSVWKRSVARDRPRARRPSGNPQASRSAHGRARLRLGLHAVSCTIWALPRSTSDSAAKTAAASTTPSTTISTGTRISRTRLSSTAALWRKPAAPAVMRLADAELLPFEFSDFAETIQKYIKELKRSNNKILVEDALERNRELEEGVFTATTDPKRAARRASGLGNRAHIFKFRAARQCRRHALSQRRRISQSSTNTSIANGNTVLASASLTEVNRAPHRKRAPTSSPPEGLPNRPWFKHQIYAPGFYTGYAVSNNSRRPKSHRTQTMEASR